MLAHELRTPITTIFVGTRLLQSERLSDGPRGEVVDALAVEAERLRDFVEDLIALAEAGAPPDAPAEPVLVQHALPPILEEEAARVPGVRYRAHIPRDLPPVVIDDVAFTRLLRKLVATVAELGSGRGTVEIVAHVEGPVLVFRVIGRQVHISGEVLDSLFQPGIALDSPLPRGRTQFGLVAARVTASRLGGDVWARRALGGLELGLELPVSVDDDSHA
ncbi:MAG TPA: histidine kinase dimerization/phospho-acceptor domain-containing protein [Candidatus Limnocylindrales bacterium]